jgi:Uma2 family endonuclease
MRAGETRIYREEFAMRHTLTQPLPGTVVDPRYPDEDGRPMGDTDYHSIAMVSLRHGLEDYYCDHDDVYVGMNLIFYYEEGNAKARRDPDILVATGVVGKHRRRSFRLWEEGVLPCTLFEVVSKKTVRVDVGEKVALYEQLRIPEYFLFDPEGRYMGRPLRGFRLRKGKYFELKPAADGSLISRQLGLRLRPEGELLRLIDLRTGQAVLTRLEKAELAEAEAREERQRSERLAAEVERLQRLLNERRAPNDR